MSNSNFNTRLSAEIRKDQSIIKCFQKSSQWQVSENTRFVALFPVIKYIMEDYKRANVREPSYYVEVLSSSMDILNEASHVRETFPDNLGNLSDLLDLTSDHVEFNFADSMDGFFEEPSREVSQATSSAPEYIDLTGDSPRTIIDLSGVSTQ